MLADTVLFITKSIAVAAPAEDKGDQGSTVSGKLFSADFMKQVNISSFHISPFIMINILRSSGYNSSVI